jgi:hypothetical protein
MSDQQERPREDLVFARTEPSRDEVVLAVHGPLFEEFADRFAAELDALLAGPWPTVTLNFAKTTAICSRCLGKIMFLRMKLQERSRTIRIRGCDADLYLQLKTTRFDHFVEIIP